MQILGFGDTPMDYDDNDFQNQNFQLDGEDIIKFPPGLQSYTLPKFDLDEHLQVHLRFDSLVETEALLGMQGQEDNHWIEDFSHGSSGIEFSSSAAESCSISRRNNVWSEATSSESVEMLLNSVGQDEMITTQTTIDGSDACDGLDTINNQMDPCLRRDDTLPSMKGEVVCTDPSLPPDICIQSLPCLSEDGAGDLPHIERMPQTHKDENSGHENLVGLEMSSVGEKDESYTNIVAEQCSLDQRVTSSTVKLVQLTETHTQNDEKCHELVLGNDQPSDGSKAKSALDDHGLSASGVAGANSDNIAVDSMQFDSAPSVQNLVIDFEDLNDQKSPQQVIDECGEVVVADKPEGLIKDDDLKEKSHILGKEAEMYDQLHGHPMESCTANSGILSSSEPKVGPVLMTEEYNEVGFSKKPNDLLKDGALRKNTEVCEHFMGSTQETSFVAMKEDKIVEEHSVESCDIDVDCSRSKPETMASVIDEKETFEGELDEILDIDVRNGSISAVKVHSPANIIHETRETVKMKTGHDNLGPDAADVASEDPECLSMENKMLGKVSDNDTSNPDVALTASGNDMPEQVHCTRGIDVNSTEVHISSSLHDKSDEILVGIGSCDADIVLSDVPILSNENSGLSTTHPGNLETEVACSLITGKEVDDSCPGHCIATVTTEVHGSPSKQNVGDESVLTGVVAEDVTVLTSFNKLEDAHQLPSGNSFDGDGVASHKDVGMPPLPVSDFMKLDMVEEAISGVSTEPSSSVLKGNCKSHPVNGPVPVPDAAQQFGNSATELISETVDQHFAFVEKCVHSTSQNEPQVSPAIRVSQEHAKGLETHSTFHSLMKEKDASEVCGVTSEKCEVKAQHVTGEAAKDGEILTLLGLSSVDESSHDIIQSKEQDGNYSLAGGDGDDDRILVAITEGDALNFPQETSTNSVTLSKNIAEFHSLKAGNGSLNDAELNCGSPTIISCKELSQSEKEYEEGGKESLDKNSPVSDKSPWISSDIARQANNIKSTGCDPKENHASEDDKSFTFEVASLVDVSEREIGKGWKPFSNVQPFELPQLYCRLVLLPKPFPKSEERTPRVSAFCQTDPGILRGDSHGSHQISDEQELNGDAKASGEHNLTSVSGTATEKDIATKGKHCKETSGPKLTIEKDGNLCRGSRNSLGTTSRAVQAEEMRQYTYFEGSSTQPCGVPSVQTSVLPDLNASAPSSTLFHQPFTDLQQVQLRSQIFVYGSLIQGTAPDEACMISAFGDTNQDSGRSVWENVWRVSMERFHNQKSLLSSPDTPLHSLSGIRVPEQASRYDPPQGKTIGTPSDRTGSKAAPSAIVNSAMSLSSPLWCISTPRDGMPYPFLDSRQLLSPVHPYQSPRVRNYVGNSTPWPSQATCPGPWAVSPQRPALDAGAQYSALSVAEAVQVASVRDSSAQRPSNIVPPSPFTSIRGPITVPTTAGLPIDPKRTAASSSKHAPADQKSRKRKKSLVAEEAQICSVSQPQTETSVGIPSSAHSASRVISSGFVPPTLSQVIGGCGADQRVIFSEETGRRIEQAKLQAEDAASLAATAVRHSQSIWSQLSIQKNSGLVSDGEAKLASAAVAAAAAATVARAAAAAAKVASDAALQAKLMADEALNLPRVGNFIQGSEALIHDGGKNLGRITPASILKGKDKVNSSGSVIVAVREAARRRVEAAEAATRRAENLDAVVRAAELAAEAVSHAGTIIAMGDPIPLSLGELVEAGPEGYWKVQVSTEHLVKTNSVCGVEQSNIDGANQGLNRSIQHIDDRSSNKKEKSRTSNGGKMPPKEHSRQSMEIHPGLFNEINLDSALSEKGLGGQKTCKTSDLAKTIGVIPESEVGSRAASLPVQNDDHERNQPAGTSTVNNIKEGTVVEVISDEDGLRGVWFSAKVLSLRAGKAHVCYNELLKDEGSDKLKEWIPLEGKGGKAPRIRIAHPMIAMKFEGTRKRRREAMGNFIWSVGDRVDALIRDGWWEGIVTEKSKDDETILTVHFPAGGDSSTVRAWDLRPSLIWKDGQWMEWSTESKCGHYEGDTPQEKRQKKDRNEIGADMQVEAPAKDKLPKDLHPEGSRKTEKSWSRMLSAEDKIFNAGKNAREQNKSDPLKVNRTDMQKEGSRVIFGVPKPGKKPKFMEVSKQYVAERTDKISEGTDSIKFAKYLIPQASRGSKNTSKVDLKGKRAADSRLKVLKSGDDGLVSDVPSSKNISSSAIELGTKGKLASAGEKTAKDEEKGSSVNDHKGKPVPDSIEPRRSHRRIQPTSRLLEGIQSSLIVAKIPPFPHDKGAKARNRSVSSSRDRRWL
ncbi:protein SWOLLEN 1-like isoform X2 [Tasmannia lanceolata]|uniref:protein SWOLLEN 1-like isoform X2 n=1 Tax=Tasmannia lanceolata TaxID=3420 RepID=UPI004064229C